MNSSNTKYGLDLFYNNFKSSIDIKDVSYLDSNYLNLTSFKYISDYIKENKIYTGNFLFGFENSLLFFEEGFFSRNTKKIYPYKELMNCSFELKGTFIKQKRLILRWKYSEFNLDVSPHTSKLNESNLKELIKCLNLSNEQIESLNNEKAEHLKKIKIQKKQNKELNLFLKAEKEGLTNKLTQISKNAKRISESKDEILTYKLTIASIKKSILHESILKNLPNQGIGSIFLYNKLNENYSYFHDFQFNKIIRFLEYIEEREKNYRALYIKCASRYIRNPDGIPIKELIRIQNQLNSAYKLLAVLVNEVNGDIVSFNKVYNELEDAGMFMTVPEKQNHEYLNQISSKLDNVMKGLKSVFESIQETNKTLSNIEVINSENAITNETALYGIEGLLWDISLKY